MEKDTSPDPANVEAPARRIECPQCGSKLPDIPVSLCPYCASPLETAADKRRLESVNASRIGRVVEHGTYESALAWDPPESSDWYDGARLAWWSGPVVLIGLAARRERLIALFLVFLVTQEGAPRGQFRLLANMVGLVLRLGGFGLTGGNVLVAKAILARPFGQR